MGQQQQHKKKWVGKKTTKKQSKPKKNWKTKKCFKKITKTNMGKKNQ